tara:strand:- start:466 stop:639 length:174 start_codon:yes stop_codon:yes gene_type:complete
VGAPKKMKKRTFLKNIFKTSLLIFSLPVLTINNFYKKKKKIYKKKFSKIWILDINDS